MVIVFFIITSIYFLFIIYSLFKHVFYGDEYRIVMVDGFYMIQIRPYIFMSWKFASGYLFNEIHEAREYIKDKKMKKEITEIERL